jgi:hypothetical protein
MTTVNAKTLGKLHATTSQAFTELEYLPQSGSINYIPKETYTFSEEKGAEVLSSDLNHLNLGALSLWYQIQNPFDFQMSFKMMSKLHDEFLKLDFPIRMNAANAYTYLFQHKDMVMASVLKGLSKEAAETLFSDKQFGMDTASKLYYWAKAVEGPEETYYSILMARFALTTE